MDRSKYFFICMETCNIHELFDIKQKQGKYGYTCDISQIINQ